MSLYNHPRYIPDIITTLTVLEAINGFKKGYNIYMNDTPSKEALCIFIAQSILETGWFKSIHNYNFGNTRCDPDKLNNNQYFTMFKAGEIINGKEIFFYPPSLGSVFQAFKTAEDGIAHHLKFLSKKERYTKAWNNAIQGNPKEYIISLKEGGYFTASLERYMKTFLSVYDRILKQIDYNEDIFTEDEKQHIMNLVSLNIMESRINSK